LKVLVILNGISRKRNLFYRKIYPELERHLQTEVWETQYAGHAEELAVKGVAQGFAVILSAGGDGTMHQVVNGVMGSAVTLGLIPLGSGNDLARSLGVKPKAQYIIDLINKQKARAIDIGMINARNEKGHPVKRYFINECSIGMGPEVVRRVNAEGRSFSASLMYLKSIIATFLFLEPEWLHIKSDDMTWSGKSRVTAIANGKTFGHGIYIAPNANMSDGFLNLFIAANPPLLRFLLLLQALKQPRESGDACLTYTTATHVEVTSEKPLPVEADGEPVGYLPMTCEVMSKRVNFLY
jgi:diacylglycerol kinase (ATP)